MGVGRLFSLRGKRVTSEEDIPVNGEPREQIATQAEARMNISDGTGDGKGRWVGDART